MSTEEGSPSEEIETQTVATGSYPRHVELSRTGPANYDWEYTRCFLIRAKGTLSVNPPLLTNMGFVLTAATTDDEDKGTGKSIPWETRVRQLLNVAAPFVSQTRTEMDFTLKRPSRIVFRLDGTFWRFSTTVSPVTMKDDFGTRYFDLQRHVLDASGVPREPRLGEEYDCVSFFCDQPFAAGLGIRHGFNINLELLSTFHGRPVALPISIDPDVENQGEPPPDP